MWLVKYQYMTQENFISFEEFKNQIINNNLKQENLSKEEIEEKVKNIINLTL